jgi:hypothetical protein
MHAAMTSRVPASIVPAGAPRPFDSATDATSKRRRQLCDGRPTCNRSVPKARTVEKRRDSALTRGRADTDRLALIDDDASGAIVRVLHFDERRRWVKHVIARLHGGDELCGSEAPRLPISVNCTPAFAPPPPVSCHTAWLSRLTMTSSPGRVTARKTT